jgi:general secretion pathway protein B
MSSILKALKKLEEEKAAKQGHRVDITRDIFGSAQQPVTGPRWPLIAGGAAGAIALGVVAYLFIARPVNRPTSASSPTEARLSAAVPSPAPAVEPFVAPPQPPREMRPVAPKPAPPRVVPHVPLKVVAKPKAPSPAKNSAASKAPAPSRTPVISANHPILSNPPAPQQQVNPAVPVATTPAPTPAAAAFPKITVSGIAYNKEAADRLAVINGVPVGEGKSVSGVKVEEIMPDKVRFSLGQKIFEVPVGRSNQ